MDEGHNPTVSVENSPAGVPPGPRRGRVYFEILIPRAGQLLSRGRVPHPRTSVMTVHWAIADQEAPFIGAHVDRVPHSDMRPRALVRDLHQADIAYDVEAQYLSRRVPPVGETDDCL